MAPVSKPPTRIKTQVIAKSSQKSSATRTSPAGQSLPASKAKTHLLELLDTVDRDRTSITITKRGRPVATLSPIVASTGSSIFGCMKGTGRITGDVVGPEPDLWNAMVE